MDIKKQIEYWINSSEDDLETAGLLRSLSRVQPQDSFKNKIGRNFNAN